MVSSKLKKKIINASFFVILGYGSSQFIRLGSNLILTRLLVPEYFGTIAIAMIFQNGLFMLSDMGLGPSLIRSKRSHEEIFQNTAWTIQVIRSVVLCLLAFLIAYPVSVIYEVPILLKLLPVLGLSSILEGLNSTSLDILDKELNQKKKITAEIIIQLLCTTITIILAYLTRSIWTLALPILLSTLFKTIWSHRINTFNNRFVIEKEAAKELMSFGKWIILSTSMFYLASQVDRILLGRFLGMGLFGVYNIALMFSELPKSVIEQLSNSVIFPAISQLPYYQIRDKIRKPRKIILLLSAVGLGFFCCFADFLINFLYDDRYLSASWMLPILALGIWPRLLVMSIDRSLLAIGKPRWLASGNIVKLIYMVIFLPVVYHFWGLYGAIIAVALNDIPLYIVINIGLKKENQGLIKQDGMSTFVLILTIILFILIRVLLNLGIPGLQNLLVTI